MKSVRNLISPGPYFYAFGLNTVRYFVSLHIQFECGKIRTRKIPNTDTFYAVWGHVYLLLWYIPTLNIYRKTISTQWKRSGETRIISMPKVACITWTLQLVYREFLYVFEKDCFDILVLWKFLYFFAQTCLKELPLFIWAKMFSPWNCRIL